MAKLLLVGVAATLLAAAAAAYPAVTLVNSTTTTPPPTAYEMLGRYNLPRGILPEGVQSYVLRPDGSFEVYLSSDCQFRVSPEYTLHYYSRVSGRISVGWIGGLEGVRVKVALESLRIWQVERDGDVLRFRVDNTTESFAVDQLGVSPRCG